MASSAVLREKPCPLLISHSPGDIPSIPHLKKALEDADLNVKVDALKKTILLVSSGGDPSSQLLMPIIRFVLPSKDRVIKKLLMLYWEVVERKQPDGKLLSQMFLVWYASLTYIYAIAHNLHAFFNLSIAFIDRQLAELAKNR